MRSLIEKNLRAIVGFMIFLTFDLMLLGAGVRALDAGLTCPDWPLCFGKAIPDYHFGVYLEFAHRVIAGVLFIIYAATFSIVLSSKKIKQQLKFLFTVGLFFLLSQVVMGGLTVLALLQSGIVTAHLSLAAIFLLILLAIQIHLKGFNVKLRKVSRVGKLLSFGTFVAVCVQLVMGGLVASNYAGKACLDFPLCAGEWIPTLSGPLGLQVLHRFTGYILVFFVVSLFIHFLSSSERIHKVYSGRILLLTLSQIMIGVMNLKLAIPAWLTVIHLAVALLILMNTFKLVYQVGYRGEPG